MQQYKIEKITLSLGLGDRDKSEQTKIQKHLRHLLSPLKLKPYKFVYTFPKSKVVSGWFKKNQSMGLKTDFRAKNALIILKMLKDTSSLNKIKFHKRNLNIGITNHRDLKLQRYNFQAPEYGMCFQIVVIPTISRPYTKKDHLKSRKPCDLRITSQEGLNNILSKALQNVNN